MLKFNETEVRIGLDRSSVLLRHGLSFRWFITTHIEPELNLRPSSNQICSIMTIMRSSFSYIPTSCTSLPTLSSFSPNFPNITSLHKEYVSTAILPVHFPNKTLFPFSYHNRLLGNYGVCRPLVFSWPEGARTEACWPTISTWSSWLREWEMIHTGPVHLTH